MRCDSCNKFVSFDSETEPEVDLSASGSEVSGTCRIVNTCQECGQELTEHTFDVEVEVDEHDVEKCKEELDIDQTDAERFDEMQTKDRRGKPIKSMRYMKHLYGVRVTVGVSCSECGFKGEVEWSDTVAGSEMESLI